MVALRRQTEFELSCEHPPVQLSEAEMPDGRHEVAGNGARVLVSRSEG
jgi:hypothetical protein